MEATSEKAKAVVDDHGLLKVYNVQPGVLREIKSTPEGGIEVTVHTRSKLLNILNRMPAFAACWGGKEWHVDIECGLARFNGIKPERALKTGLYNAGFSKAQIDDLLKECKSKPLWDFCPRQR